MLVAGVLLSACGDDSAPDRGASSGAEEAELTKVDLLLPAPAGVNFTAFHVAKKLYWNKEGLDVKPVVTDGSSVAAQQLAAGNGKYGSVGLASVYLANVEGANLVGLAEQTHDDIARLSVPEESSVQSVSDLDGKSIGITSAGDGSVPIVKALVEQAGLVPDEDVRFVIVGKGGPAVAKALESGRIAAYAHGQSDVPGMEINAGVKLRSIMPEEFVGLPGNVLAISQETRDNPEELEIAQKLARGWLQAGVFVREQPDEALKIACEAVPRDCQNQEVAKLQISISGETQYPTDIERPGYVDPDKARTLIEAVNDGSVPLPLEDVVPDTYVDAIGEGITIN